MTALSITHVPYTHILDPELIFKLSLRLLHRTRGPDTGGSVSKASRDSAVYSWDEIKKHLLSLILPMRVSKFMPSVITMNLSLSSYGGSYTLIPLRFSHAAYTQTHGMHFNLEFALISFNAGKQSWFRGFCHFKSFHKYIYYKKFIFWFVFSL